MVDRTGTSLVIPAWNEPEAIGGVLDEVPPGVVDEVLVIVGSQADPTGDVARAHGARVLVQARPGYGAACWTGANEALAHGAAVIAFLDGDYADPPAALPRVLEPIRQGRADLVLGCRDLRRYPDALPAHARLGNGLVCRLMRVLLHTDFHDLPSCKAIRAESLRQLGMREMTYGWTVEMLAKAARAHLRIQQIDIEYRPRRGGHSKVAGDPRASVLAACRLLRCTVTYATSRQWSAVGGQ
ncbi:MAG: glycosyltransferase family 2 protein [Chloroflexi bacterium]|nr:glycosyltransferase family 2 protein [Chloroflexota bacterium]